MKPIVWLTHRRARELGSRLFHDAVVASSVQDFLAAPRDAGTMAFVDGQTLASLDEFGMSVASAVGPSEWRQRLLAATHSPIVALCDEPVATAVGWLRARPYLSHVMSVDMLDGKLPDNHLDDVMSIGGTRDLLDWVSPTAGRRVRLTHAVRRGERLERMTQFFAAQGVAGGPLGQLRDATDELLTNAFYEAPVVAGAEKHIDRTRDVALPEEFACDIAYGCRGELAIVRVRDPFGALTRDRLVNALGRRARHEKQAPDARTEEAGLWRVFSTASIIAVSVVGNRHTEVLVGYPAHGGPGPNPYALHLFFKEGAKKGFWKRVDDDTGDPTGGGSVTLTRIED